METSRLSVAFGYLAVLLGYLSLAAPVIQRRIREQGLGGERRDLIESIQEFIAMHRNVGSKVHELEGLVSQLRRQRSGLAT